MKTKHIALSAACLAMSAGAVAAQTTTTQPGEAQPMPPAATSPIRPGSPSTEAPSTEAPSQFAQRQMPGQWLATDFISLDVYGPDKERIGNVNNILFDENGKIVAVLVGLGGFLGIGEKTVALPYDSVKSEGPGRPLTTNRSKAKIDSAPSFVTGRMSTTGSSK